MSEYSKPFQLLFNGVILAQTSECQQEVTSEDKLVKTLNLGTAGHSSGAEVGRVTFKSAIPESGLEKDFFNFCRLHTTVNFAVRSAGKLTSYRGRFMNVSERSSIDSPNEIDGTFEGVIVDRVILS